MRYFLLVSAIATALVSGASAFAGAKAKAPMAPAAPAKQPEINVKALLDKVSKNASSDDEVATVKMIVTEATGAKSEKKMELRRKGKENKQSVLVRMQSPADIKGISLLSKSEGEKGDQWLFSPSNKQVRRILSSSKGGGFLGSELSYEDMEAGSDAKVLSKSLGRKTEDGREYVLIENKAKGESTYGRTVLWIEEDKSLIGKVEYFDKKDKLLKVSLFHDYKKFGNTWRAQTIEVRNLQNQRGTTLALQNMRVNQGLRDGEFTESALSEGD